MREERKTRGEIKGEFIVKGGRKRKREGMEEGRKEEGRKEEGKEESNTVRSN